MNCSSVETKVLLFYFWVQRFSSSIPGARFLISLSTTYFNIYFNTGVLLLMAVAIMLHSPSAFHELQGKKSLLCQLYLHHHLTREFQPKTKASAHSSSFSSHVGFDSLLYRPWCLCCFLYMSSSLYPFLSLERGLLSEGFTCSLKELTPRPGLCMAMRSLLGSAGVVHSGGFFGSHARGAVPRISAARLGLSSSTLRDDGGLSSHCLAAAGKTQRWQGYSPAAPSLVPHCNTAGPRQHPVTCQKARSKRASPGLCSFLNVFSTEARSAF